MIRLQKNDFGTIAILPDGRVEVLSAEGAEYLEGVKRGEFGFSSAEIEPHVLYDFDVDPERFHFQAPAIAFLEVTNLCNLTCKHCYAHSSPQGKRQNELSMEEIKTLLDQWDEMGVLQVFLSGGEVFAHPRAVDIIKYARSKRFLTQIFTNGLLIKEEQLKALPRGTSFFVSFDSAKPENTIRGKMTYEKLKWLLEKVRQYGHACRVAVNVHSQNLHEVPRIFAWCKENGFARPQWIETMPVGRARQYPHLIIPPEQTAQACEVYEHSMRPFLTSQPRATGAADEVQEVDTIKFCQRFEAALGVEMSGRMMAYVTSVGDVFPSSNFAAENREWAGNLRDRPFTEIWKSGFTHARESTFAQFKDCAVCPVAKAGIWCQFRCRSISENLHGDPKRCGATEHIKSFMVFLNDFADRVDQNQQRLEIL